MPKWKVFVPSLILVFGLAATYVACSPVAKSPFTASTSTEDASATGAAALLIGGALQRTSNSGTLALNRNRKPSHLPTLLNLPRFFETAEAVTGYCPTLATSSGCTQISTDVVDLNYSGCNFRNSSAIWQGQLEVSTGRTAVTCGSGLAVSSIADVVFEQFVSSTSSPGTVTRTAAGTVVTLDDTNATIKANFDQDPLDGTGSSGVYFDFAAHNSGGGREFSFTNGLLTQLTLAESIESVLGGTTLWNHTLAGTLSITENHVSGSNVSWVVNSGNVLDGKACTDGLTLFLNVAQVMGSSCFENVEYSSSCCQPVSGTIITSFVSTNRSQGSQASALNNTTETLEFVKCGMARYTVGDVTTNVTLNSCY